MTISASQRVGAVHGIRVGVAARQTVAARRDRIESTLGEWLASKNTPDRQPKGAPESVARQGVARVSRAARMEATCGRRQWRYPALIGDHHTIKRPRQRAAERDLRSYHGLIRSWSSNGDDGGGVDALQAAAAARLTPHAQRERLPLARVRGVEPPTRSAA